MIVMFKSLGSFAGFVVGVGLTLGLLLSPDLVPRGWVPGLKGAALQWPLWAIALLVAGGLAVLALTLWTAGRWFSGADSWKNRGIIAGTILIAFVANGLFTLLVELFALKSGMRALIAMLGVPVIYGNLGATLGKTSLFESMNGILTGALATMGTGYIIAAIIRGW